MAPQLACLGLGNLGQAISTNLIQRANLSVPLILWARHASRATSLKARIGHSVVANTIADAVAQADIIFTCLPDQDAVNETFDGVFLDDVEGKLFVECSAITPGHVDALVREVQAAGAEMVGMAVFEKSSMADAAALTCALAGAAEQVERVRPYCAGIIGQEVIDLSGQEPSMATLLRVTGYVLIVNMIESIAEGYVLAEKTGLGTANLQKLVAALFPGIYMTYSERMRSGSYLQAEARETIGMAQHQISEILHAAMESKTSLPALEAAVNHMEIVYNHVGPAADISAIYGAVRLESGLEY